MAITQWPYPRVLSTQFHLFLLHANAATNSLDLYEMATSGAAWSGTLVGSVGVANTFHVDIADFGPFYAVSATSNVIRVFLRDVSIPLGSPGCLVEDLGRLFGTCCNFKQVFVGGNFYDGIDAAPGGILWSGIGHYTFDAQVMPTAGKSLLWKAYQSSATPVVWRVLPLQDAVAIYSDAGIAMAIPGYVEPVATFGQQQVPRLGIISPYHVAGDTSVHGFIDMSYDFWLLEASGKLTKRGYRQYIVALATEAQPVVVSYLPLDRRFYISNGLHCLVVNDHGAFTCHQCPSGVVLQNTGAIYGTFADNADYEARIVVDETDFGSRGLKSVENVTAGVLTADTSVATSLRVEYSMDNGKTFTARPWVPGGPLTEAVVRTTALTFRVGARASTYVGTEFQSLMANVKYSDQRFKRGTVPSQYEVGSA